MSEFQPQTLMAAAFHRKRGIQQPRVAPRAAGRKAPRVTLRLVFRPLSAFVSLAALVFLTQGCGRNPMAAHRLIVMGVDGMDPGFLERHWDALPHLAALARQGSFSRLATTIPPQSPVAWSTFITGMDPGGHGVFDFVHRNPATMGPFSSMAQTEDPAHTLSIGPYMLPLMAGHVRLLRQGMAFWQLLEDRGVPATIIHIPNNFPPLDSKARTLAGMGTPDLQGTFGTFAFYTNDSLELTHEVPGGRIVKVRCEGGHVVIPIEGPPDTLRRDRAQTSVELTVDIDPREPAARFHLGDTLLVLNEREWSGWIRAEFPLIPGFKSAHGMFRIYVKQLHPVFQLYVSAVNIDPFTPDLPISTPGSYSRQLAQAIGPFYTQGIAEDTAVYRAGYFNLQEFLEQSRLVEEDQFALLRHTFEEFHSGLFFFYFSTLDQNSHMLWGKHENELLKSYQAVDRAIGWVAARAGSATILVMSDHGFTRFDRAVHLNTWLRSQGFLTLDEPAATSSGEGFAHVDWSKTQAYAMGLNGLYVNLRGREKHGSVSDGAPRAELLREISKRLLALRDPRDGAAVVDAVYDPRKVFHGHDLAFAPDLIVGYAPGFRGSWQTALGAVPETILEDNQDAWIGDHCIDPARVPGSLIANRPIRLKDPGLADVTVTILREFGIDPRPEMLGRPILR
jgi:predicted AlkP superfamily phosphohydrolase/phosphomutase